jgi:hypothetical protein
MLVINDQQIEGLASRIALAQGISITEAVRESLVFLAGQRGILKRSERQPLRERLSCLAKEVDAVPKPDKKESRTDDEILGYKDDGVW